MRWLAVALALCANVAHAQPSDPLEAAAELARIGSNEHALEAIARLPAEDRRRPRARYLEGRLLERVGRFEEAARVFPVGDASAPLPDPVRRDAELRRALALARSGHCDQARDLLLPFARDPQIEARRAECALAMADLSVAIDELRTVVRRGARDVDLFAARFELADALARSGQRAEADDLLLGLWVERSDHPEADLARTALEALRGAPIELTDEQHMRRADRLYEARRYDEAIAELDAAGRPRGRGSELRRWLHLYGMALYDRRNRWERAAEVLAESAGAGGPHAEDDQFHAARSLSRADRDPEAIAAYRRFATEHPEHAKAAEATYLAAWLEIRHGIRGGERNMHAFIRSPGARTVPHFMREASWQLAFTAFRSQRYTRAARLCVEYASMSPDPLVRARGFYWRGRSYQAAGDRRRAIEAYREALYVEPLHWYALLARQRLVELGEDPGLPFPDPPEAGEAPALPALTLPEDVRFYADLGLRADALAALETRENEIRRQVPGDDGVRALVSVFTTLDEPSRLRRLAVGQRLLRQRAAPGPRDLWQWNAAFPRPWRSRVESAASAVQLTPAHLYAIMWQESGFDPDAVSYADAIGLMQLLPTTADRVARNAGIELTRDMLFDPAMNIRLGAAYVGGLAGRFGIPLAFSAFNGGGHKVEQWLQAHGETELDIFVEEIPYEQTRNYTRRVTTHLAHYLYLEDPARGWPMDLPRTVAPAQ